MLFRSVSQSRYMAVVDEAEKAKKLKEALNGTIIATLADYMGECGSL